MKKLIPSAGVLLPCKIFTLLIAVLFINPYSYSQEILEEKLPKSGKNEVCISDRLNKELAQKDSTFRKKLYQQTSQPTNNINPPDNAHFFSAEEIFTIPVVVHIIHLGESVGVGTNISDAQVNSAINDLNDKYGYSNTGVNTNIEFCLAKSTPNGGATNGIVRIDGSGVTNYSQYGIISDENIATPNDSAVKSISLWPNSQYYNIWVVSEINGNNGGAGTQGYAYFAGAPSYIDGSVVMYNAFGYDPDGTNGYDLKSYTNRNVTLAHELGHALVLFHTFQGDGNGSDCPIDDVCGLNSDCVSDTDPHRRQDGVCGASGLTCFGSGTDLSDIVTNIMSYSGDICQAKFSQGQKDRMRAVLDVGGLRESLANSDKCNPPAAPISNFTSNTESGCVNSPINFQNTSQNGNDSWDWVFENAGTSNLENPLISWSQAGIYDVSLTANNPIGMGNTELKTDYIQIFNSINTYCEPNTINVGNFGTGIDSVYLNTIVHSNTSNSNDGYKNFICSQNTILNTNTNYSFRIKLNGNNQEFCNIYIDYNGDGFYNETEKIYSSPNQSIVHSGNFTTPSNVKRDTLLGFRVISDFNTLGNNSCNNVTYGEIEDYGIYFEPFTCVNTTSNTSITTCDDFTWNSINYSSSGTYTYTTTNSQGCDSIASLNLTINYSNAGTDTQIACNSYVWIDGVTYTASNTTATHTLTNQAGCDSVVTLNLTILKSTIDTINISAQDSITWHGILLTDDLDTTITHHNANVNGCDSTEIVRIRINHLTDIEINNFVFKIFPNPTKDKLVLESNEMGEYWLMNIHGKHILRGKKTGFRQEIDLSRFSKGMYLLLINRNRFQIIKQ